MARCYAKLVDSLSHAEYPLKKDRAYIIGRDEELCDIRTNPSVSGVSRAHGAVRYIKGKGREGFMYFDLKSSFGTFAKGSRIEKMLLEDGDEMILSGMYSLIFQEKKSKKRKK